MKMAEKKTANKDEIFRNIESFVENREEIIFAYIFGSFTEDEVFNDIDLAIYIDEDNALTREIFYEIELSNQLGKIIKNQVDIIVLNRASNIILHRAAKGKLIKNNDDNMRINFMTSHWKQYWDFKNKIHEHIEEMKVWV